MSISLEHVNACLPITALKAVQWSDHTFIFEGQGPFLQVIDDQTGDVFAQVRAFKRNHVHGFITIPRRRESQDDSYCESIILWGGKSVRAFDVCLDKNHAVSLTASSVEVLTPDWIMSGCAAAADQPDTAYLITANNALLRIKLEYGTYDRYSTNIGIYQLATSVKCILYAADLIALSHSHVLIASGTAFGEIIVWSCFISESEPSQAKAVASIHHFFTGHDGSIFGVRIFPNISSLNGGLSGRLLASCSDDRTVRIWDISDCENKSSQDLSAYSTDGFELRSTGFGSGLGSELHVAKAFGHAARIWSVNLCSPKKDNPTTLCLVTRGEDRACVVWELSWESPSFGTTKYHLREISSTQPHLGKHIWALTLCDQGEETVVYTGGADGALKSFRVNKHAFSSTQHAPQVQKMPSGPDAPKTLDFVAPDCLIACSLRSELRLGYVSPMENANVTWETICTADDLRSFSLITGIPQHGLALIANSQGLIRLYNHSTKSINELVNLRRRPRELFVAHRDLLSESFSFVASYFEGEEAALINVTGWNSSCPRAEVVTFSLPMAPYVIFAASLVHHGKFLLLGSELGGLAVYRIAGLGLASKPLVDSRRIHGHEGTSCIQIVPSTPQEGQEYILTCGRDGNYCVHKLHVHCGEDDSPSLETLDRTSSGLGRDLFGLYFEETTGDLMIYGFRAQSFVLRNETKHQDIMSIASGGARRTWVYQHGTKDSKPLLVWLERTNLHTLRIQCDLNRSIRAGGHGREIRAMDGLSAIRGRGPIFATGAEDTHVRIFAASSRANAGPWGSFECLRILDQHRSGVQQVRWSMDGQYLFTSAGHEEFFVWRVRWLPTIGISVKMEAACPKSDPDSEMRITSFDVLEVEESRSGQGFLVCLTLSNSTIKIFHFSPSEGYRFTLLAHGRYMTNCLTQTNIWVKDFSVSLITAATDGYFTLWDLTNTLKSFYTISPSGLKAKRSFEGSCVQPENITCESRYQVLSNSVKAMELVPLSDTATVVVAAGDDNSLSISLLKTYYTNTGINAHVASFSIPDAHAASVTALKVLRREQLATDNSGTEVSKLTIVTSGNDHRVKFWSVTVDPTKHHSEGISVEFLLDRYSAVADIASLGFLQDSAHEGCADPLSGTGMQGKLLVCGVGMEMLKASLQ
ncbi:uncharacterized protein N7482_000855 [Penicillium canariense]|uniref:WD repeat protein n=1 Tax=Penicillium canariense TaxID=189055 RepID=A0A9W9LSD6_9EURO|nr:uncharacterized protein N7482_000855 [Penicillium canariense]KAJ5174978.1 hypothetical protein N7482_000855 [Penicillium canariense]